MKGIQDITFAAKTDTGLKRDHNEDNFVCQTVWDRCLLAVCIDGVGGYKGGEVAAKTTAETLANVVSKSNYSDDKINILTNAIIEANNTILSVQSENFDYRDMACVMTAILLSPEEGLVYMAHIGDTRLYEYTNGTLTKLSHDHSPVGILEDNGLITEEEAMRHPNRNIIERCLGREKHDAEDIETAVFPLKSETIYLLCSDGLTDMIDKARITDILASNIHVEDKATKLIEAANEAGGKDNITVLLVRVPANEDCMQNSSEEIPVNECESQESLNSTPENIVEESPLQHEEKKPTNMQRGMTTTKFHIPLIAAFIIIVIIIVALNSNIGEYKKYIFNETETTTPVIDEKQDTIQQPVEDTASSGSASITSGNITTNTTSQDTL